MRDEAGTLSEHLADATSNYNRVVESLYAHQGHKMDIEHATQNLATRVTAAQQMNCGNKPWHAANSLIWGPGGPRPAV